MEITYRYYKGEDRCPESFSGTTKEIFWNGEKSFADNVEDVDYWIEYGKQVKSTLSGVQLHYANKYTPIEFAIVVYIEIQYQSHDPYDDLRWIYEY